MKELTKKALADSLKKLLAKKTLDSITVVELAEDCGVNRQTFYYHFQDIYGLLEWIFANETKQAIGVNVTYQNWSDCLLNIFSYILENKDFFINVCRSISHDALERYLYDVQRHYLNIVIAELDTQKKLSQKDKKFVERFFAYAIVGIILDWIKKGMKEDYREINSRIAKLTAGDISKFIQ